MALEVSNKIWSLLKRIEYISYFSVYSESSYNGIYEPIKVKQKEINKKYSKKFSYNLF